MFHFRSILHAHFRPLEMYGLFLQLGCRLCEALNPKYCLPPPYVSIELLPRHRAIDGRCNTCVIIIAQVRGLIIWSLEKPTGGTSLRAPKCSPSCKGIEILQHGVYMLDVLGLTFKASPIIGTSTKYEFPKPRWEPAPTWGLDVDRVSNPSQLCLQILIIHCNLLWEIHSQYHWAPKQSVLFKSGRKGVLRITWDLVP